MSIVTRAKTDQRLQCQAERAEPPRPRAWHCSPVTDRSQTGKSHTGENLQIQKRVSWEQTPHLPTTKHPEYHRDTQSCLYRFLLARTARPLPGMDAVQSLPGCPGPRTSLTLQLRSHSSMMASQDSRRSSLLRQKQRVQCLSRDPFTESSASGLSTFHWEEGTWKPL